MGRLTRDIPLLNEVAPVFSLSVMTRKKVAEDLGNRTVHPIRFLMEPDLSVSNHF